MNIESSLYSISLAPKLASEIKKYTEHKDPITGERKIDYISNTVAHAILGAVVAELQGNSALAGGLGAAYGERSAEIIAKILYPDKAIDKLSQEEKQQVSALAQLAAGLTTAALGGDAQDINTAMAGGKNALENNIFTYAGDNSESIQFQTGVVQVLETESQIYYECKGDADCIGQKELEARIGSEYYQFSEEQRKIILYNIPIAGLVYGMSDTISEGNINNLLEAGLSQAQIGRLILMVYQNLPNKPSEEEVLSTIKNIDEKRTQQTSNNNQTSSTNENKGGSELNPKEHSSSPVTKPEVGNEAGKGNIPNIRGTQVGLRNPAQIDSMKRDMMNGNYDFKKPDNIIAGYVDAKGNYYITEGHHRMAAAMEIYKKTGDTSYVNKLLLNGKWTEIRKPPVDSKPLPKR